MQKAILPLRYIGISQPMYGKTSHIGLKAIDFGWNQQYLKESTELLAPFDGTIVWKKGHVIAFQSNDLVEYADGTIDYMTSDERLMPIMPTLNMLWQDFEHSSMWA